MRPRTARQSSAFNCQIRIKNHLDNCWLSWFEGLNVQHPTGGQVLITGIMPDQSALFGLLNKVRDLNLKVISINIRALDARAKKEV